MADPEDGQATVAPTTRSRVKMIFLVVVMCLLTGAVLYIVFLLYKLRKELIATNTTNRRGFVEIAKKLETLGALKSSLRTSGDKYNC